MSAQDRPPVPAVHCEGVRFRWQVAGPDCLDIAQFVVQPGERIFLHGPSGSGKSTLLSLVAGVLTPTCGKVCVLGQDLASLRAGARDRYRADQTGFIFQLFNLVPYLSALENILLPCRFSAARRARVDGAPEAEARRLAARLDLEAGLLHSPATALSVGQQQRVAAARALIGRPPLVVADEPTSALDEDRQRVFIDLLLGELQQTGGALLFVSHDRRLAGHFDRVVELPAINRAGGG